MIHIDIDNLHTRLEEVRKMQKISFKKMGDCIGYSDTGFRTALMNKNLSLDHLKIIIEDFELEEFFSGMSKYVNDPLSLDKAHENSCVEDIIADKILEKIKPYLEKIGLIEAVLGKVLIEWEDVKDSIKKN